MAAATCWMPASARTLRRKTATGSRRSRRARSSQRSMVEAAKRTGSPLIGCCQVRAASFLISARSSPFGGGAANNCPITEKRKCAQRWCSEACFDALMSSDLRVNQEAPTIKRARATRQVHLVRAATRASSSVHRGAFGGDRCDKAQQPNQSIAGGSRKALEQRGGQLCVLHRWHQARGSRAPERRGDELLAPEAAPA